MKLSQIKDITFTLSVAALLVLAAPTESYAAEKNTSGSFTNNQGKTTTWQKNVNREKGSSNKTFNWQNDNGEGNSTLQRQWNKDTGTANSERTTTNAKGKTATTSWNAEKTDNGFTSEGSRTGFNGKTITGQTTLTKNDDGSTTRTSTYTNEDGESRTVEKTVNRFND